MGPLPAGDCSPYPSSPKSKFPVPRTRPRPRGEIFPVPVGYMGIRWGENPREQQVPTATGRIRAGAAERSSRNPSRSSRARIRAAGGCVGSHGRVEPWTPGESWSRAGVPPWTQDVRVEPWTQDARLGTWGVIERRSQEQRASSAAAEQPSRGRTGGRRSRDAACRGPRSTEEGTVAWSGCGRAAEAEMRIRREQPPARHPRQSAKKKQGLAT
jgi:hypothetical protein